MNVPLISIIVPIYNVEQYLEKCISSIQNQTYRNLQIILVDDGSTDNSGNICDRYAREDGRIIVIHQTNQGLVAARKSGLARADGAYVGFVDGDDDIEPEMYEALANELENSQADMVHSGYWNGDYEVIRFQRKIIDLEKNKESFLKDVITMSGIAPSIWSKLFKADLIKECYRFVEDTSSYGEDLICLCAVAIKAVQISLLDKAFYHYRIRENSISHDIGIDKVKKEIGLYNNICKVLNIDNCYENLENEMDYFLINHILMGLERINKFDFQIQRYCFPNPQMLQGKRVLLYGAGSVGKDMYSQISRYTDCDIVAWVDSFPEKYSYQYVRVDSPDVITKIQFDLILIAVKNEMDAVIIKKMLNEKNIENDKICWLEPKLLF